MELLKKKLSRKRKKKTRDVVIVVKFDKKIYKIRAIKSAVKKYKRLADFDLLKEPDWIKVRLKVKDKKQAEFIKNEFCNYVLFLMKS